MRLAVVREKYGTIVKVFAIIVFLLSQLLFGIYYYSFISKKLVVNYEGVPQKEVDELRQYVQQNYSIPDVIRPGKKIELPEIEYRDFDFLCWTDSNGKNISSVSWETKVPNTLEIYAIFEPRYYKILYSDEKGNVLKEDVYIYGMNKMLDEYNPFDDESDFVGWADSSGTVIREISEKLKGDIRLYPVFQGKDDIKPEDKSAGAEAIGYIQIGDYFAYLYEGTDQTITDAEESANLFSYNGKKVIADHRSQGIGEIMENNRATLFLNGKEYELQCVYRKQGYNRESALVLLDESDAFAGYENYSYLIYTCNDYDGVSISITYWIFSE